MEPVIVARSEHSISRKLIDPDAVKVLYRLHRAGYLAYLVGGGVRDLLVGRNPKDFDISTDAHPHQVKRLFRNCRLIGRRFRLAHVHFGGKIVEVSTFRKRSEASDDADEDLLIRSDNTFGNAEEDALRRDFTINGLFYDIGTFSLIDYVGGLSDLENKTIRTIGDPGIRFREDPIRMIRAVKFAARLGFDIEPETFEAMQQHVEEVSRSAQPRLLEEVYRLLGEGAAVDSFRLLQSTGLLQVMIPEVSEYIDAHGGADGDAADNPLWRWLAHVDARQAAGDAPGNASLIAMLLAELAFPESEEAEEEPPRITPESEDFIREIVSSLGVPRRDTERVFQVYRAQRRFIGQRGRRFSPRAFVTKNYFPNAFEFFAGRAEVFGRYSDAVEKWQKQAEEAGVTDREDVDARRPRRRRRRRSDESETRTRRSPASDESGGRSRRSSATDERGPRSRRSASDEAGRPRRRSSGQEDGPPKEENRPAPERDSDEDSQIRFLGWSDQPEILRPRSDEKPPVTNPYHTQARRGGFRGGNGSDGGHRSGRPSRGSNGARTSGTSSGRSGNGRRDGRRGRRRNRQD